MRCLTHTWVARSRSDDATARAEFFGARLASTHLHPIPEQAAERCTEQMGMVGPWYERLPHFRMDFMPSSGNELQSEYFVPLDQGAQAIRAVRRLGEQISPHLLVSEIRVIAEDDLWMSPCYRRPSLAIHFAWKPDWPAVRPLLFDIENALAPFAPRPHWAKLFTMSPAALQEQYERLPDFRKLLLRFDPNGKFHNSFLLTNLY